MEENKDAYYSLNDILNNLKSFWVYLKKKLWLLLLLIIVGVSVGITFYNIQKPKYQADTTFILEEKSSGVGGIASLASQFGFDLGGMSGGGSIFSGDNILDILKSKRIIQEVLISKVDSSKGVKSKTLADLFLDFSEWRKSWANNTELKDIAFSDYQEDKKLSLKQDSVLNLIHDFLVKKSINADRANKKGSIIKLSVAASNNLFAKLMSERIVDAAAKLYLNIKTGTAQNNIAQLQRRSDSLLYLLNRKSYTVAASQLLDINPGVKVATVPAEIANRDKAVISTLYAEVTKNLEASKLILSQQTPVIQLLDRPDILMDDHKKGLAFFIVIGAVISAFIYVSGALLSFMIARMLHK